MKYLYACSFHVDESGGKSRATYQKIRALSTHVDSFELIDARAAETKLGRLVEFFRVEFRSLQAILSPKTRPHVFISRGFCGALSVRLARSLGVYTVREVHADAVGEASLTPYHPVVRKLIEIFSRVAVTVDNISDMRIFNHPLLLDWYRANIKDCDSDIYTYNGADLNSVSSLDKQKAREKFQFLPNRTYLVFVGAASKWHGVEQLAKLQKEFDSSGDPISIVCGGGQVSQSDDPDGRLINYFPMDARSCADLIRASDACLLSVSANRVSPGSPLKLYDYLAAGKCVITQEDTLGYSDEVMRFSAGITTDLRDPARARRDILKCIRGNELLSYENQAVLCRDLYSWEGRMFEWKSSIERQVNMSV